MDIGILGPLTVVVDGREVTIPAPKQRTVLALLVLRRNQVVSVETLVDEIWGNRVPATATKIIHGYVSQLRKVLGDGVPATRPSGYRLTLARSDVDADRFEASFAQGCRRLATGEPGQAAEDLDTALGLWRGAALAEFHFHGTAADELDRLAELRQLALEYRLEAAIAAGDHTTAIPELRMLVHEHPLRESLRGSLMLALYRAGRQADALAVYADARSVLVSQLGIEPSESLQHLQAAVLAHDPALRWTGPAGLTRTSSFPVREPEPGPSGPAESPATGSVPPTSISTTLISPAPTAPHHPGPTRGPRTRPWPRRRLTVVAAAVIGTAAILGMTAQDSPQPAIETVAADSVGFLPTNGSTVTGQAAIPGSPTALAVDGSTVWTVEPASQAVVRIDARTHAVVQTIPVGGDPSGVAVGGGSVWVANHDADTVTRISPETNAVVDTIGVGTGPVAVAVGFGSVWVTNGDARTLTRLDEGSGRVIATIDTNAVGRAVAVGSGSVWVTDEASDRIVGVDPTTNSVVSTASVGSGPTDITAADGALWVVDSLAGTVSRVDPATLTVTLTAPIPGGPSTISAAAGAVWVGEEFGAQIVRIDDVTGVVTATVPLGSTPEALAATSGGVWISTQPSGSGHRGGRLVVMGDVTSIDPSGGDISPQPADLVYDGLTRLRHTGGTAGTQIVPDLAVALPQPTAQGTTYTFHLSPGIRYSDGTLVAAVDFRRGLERLLRLNSSLTPLFSHVVGAETCRRRPTCDLSAGVPTPDASTVSFRLSAPDPRFLEELANLVPIPDGTPTRDVGTTAVAGTGPYDIQTFVPGHLLTLERNRYFRVWSAAARPDGYPDEIDYLVGASEDEAARRVAAGQADLVQLVGDPDAAKELAAQHPAQVHVESQQATVFAFLNTRTPPFDDLRVRRAVNFAVDRQRLADLLGAGLARPTCQMIPPTTTGYRTYCPYTVDPDATGQWRGPDLQSARSLVEASGTAGQAVKLWTPSYFRGEADYLAGVLDQLGYRTSVDEVADTDSYFDDLDRAPTAQAGMFGWFGNELAVDILATLTCTYDPNPAHFCDPRIDAEIQRLGQIQPSDPDQSVDLAARIDREITDQAPWVPLFTPQTVTLTSSRVANYQSERGLVLIDQLWVQ